MSAIACPDCGSESVRGIMHGYVEGPLVVDEDGRVQVDGSDFVPFEDHFGISEADEVTALCTNCGSGAWRRPIPAKTLSSESSTHG